MEVDVIYTELSGESYFTLVFPDDWSGLSVKQWRAAINIKILFEADGKRYKKLHRWMYDLCGDKKVLGVPLDNLTGIVETIEWIGEMPSHAESYMSGNILMRGPGKFMNEFTMQQFGLAQQCMVQFGKDGLSEKERIKHLRSLMAVCWMPRFLSFSARMVDVYMPLMRLVPEMMLVMNMYNVWGMVQELKNSYEWVYDESEDSSGPDHAFRSLIESLAGGKFGDYYQVQKAKLHDVMVHMDHNAYRVMEMNKAAKKETIDW